MEDIKERRSRPKRLSENSNSRVEHHSRVKYTHMGNRTYKDSMSKKTFKDFAEACWDTHKQVGFKMKGGKRVPNCVPKNEEAPIQELGPAAMARRKRMRARMGVLQKKYGDARKAGIHPSKVSQRHNKMTVKKR